ncbi:MAG TPA: hypothetical protein VK528_06765 [Flavobacterium sp.]|nr:hypothetical protein [Flavobacterium sp.]
MKNKLLLLLLICCCSCEKETETDFSDYNNVMSVYVTDDNALGNGVEKVHVVADFRSDFNTETDSKVSFQIYKETLETQTGDIRQVDNKKTAEIFITHDKVEQLLVKAVITINGVEISKTVFVNFRDARPEFINVHTDDLLIEPENFNLLDITTETTRLSGKVSRNILVTTEVRDVDFHKLGIFSNYQDRTDADGKVKNRFTLGPDTYVGKLYIISRTLNELDEEIRDTAIVYSQIPE